MVCLFIQFLLYLRLLLLTIQICMAAVMGLFRSLAILCFVIILIVLIDYLYDDVDTNLMSVILSVKCFSLKPSYKPYANTRLLKAFSTQMWNISARVIGHKARVHRSQRPQERYSEKRNLGTHTTQGNDYKNMAQFCQYLFM